MRPDAAAAVGGVRRRVEAKAARGYSAAIASVRRAGLQLTWRSARPRV